MNRADTKFLMRICNWWENEKLKKRFRSLGDGRKVYTIAQKHFALSFIDESGVRATAEDAGDSPEDHPALVQGIREAG